MDVGIPGELHLPTGLEPFGNDFDRYRTAGSLNFWMREVTRKPALASSGARTRGFIQGYTNKQVGAKRAHSRGMTTTKSALLGGSDLVIGSIAAGAFRGVGWTPGEPSGDQHACKRASDQSPFWTIIAGKYAVPMQTTTLEVPTNSDPRHTPPLLDIQRKESQQRGALAAEARGGGARKGLTQGLIPVRYRHEQRQTDLDSLGIPARRQAWPTDFKPEMQ
jgi:hypothetical protein